MSYPVFTIAEGSVTLGAVVQSLTLKGVGEEIPAILVGESGRGRTLGVVCVEGLEIGETLLAADIAPAKSGHRLVASSEATDRDFAIVVFRTPIGFRGANVHSGDRTGWRCGCGSTGTETHVLSCGSCGATPRSPGGVRYTFGEFPATVLTEGRIAEGDAGRMGSGQQFVALVPKGVVFRTAYSGRLYGKAPAHYCMFDGSTLVGLTNQERMLLDRW